jgi:Phage integrase central domain
VPLHAGHRVTTFRTHRAHVVVDAHGAGLFEDQRRLREAAKKVIEAREVHWNAEHARQWRASIAEVDPVLGSLPVAAIDTPLVLKAVESIWKRAQTTGDRTRQRIEVEIVTDAKGRSFAIVERERRVCLPPLPPRRCRAPSIWRDR